jgi:hypothetical protein
MINELYTYIQFFPANLTRIGNRRPSAEKSTFIREPVYKYIQKRAQNSSLGQYPTGNISVKQLTGQKPSLLAHLYISLGQKLHKDGCSNMNSTG